MRPLLVMTMLQGFIAMLVALFLALVGCGGAGAGAGHVSQPAGQAELQRQLGGEYFSTWGIRLQLVLADPPEPSACRLVLLPSGPYGYHGWRGGPGNRYCYVDMARSIAVGTPSASASHEVLELGGDLFGGVREICDPVAPYGYVAGTRSADNPIVIPARDGYPEYVLLVADFTLPAYWRGGPAPWVRAAGVPASGGITRLRPQSARPALKRAA